jgi:tetratricopeptide (TPR) repeat protein
MASKRDTDWYERAKELYDQERYLAAGAAYEMAAKEGQRREIALYNAACSYALAGKKDAALRTLEASLAAGFDQHWLVFSDEDLNSLRGEPRFASRAAISQYGALRAKSSRDEDAWQSAGVDLMRAGDYDHAIDAFTRSHAIAENSDALYNLACAQALKGESAKALASLERAILSGPVSPEHLAKDADLASLHGHPRFDGLQKLADDLELDTHGIFLLRSRKISVWRREIPRYERVTREHPKVGRAWFNLGYAQLGAGEARASIASHTKALELGHRRPVTMYNLACAYAQARETDSALDWLQRSEAAGMKLEKYVYDDGDLDPIRSDRRFKALLDRLDQRLAAERREERKHKTQK